MPVTGALSPGIGKNTFFELFVVIGVVVVVVVAVVYLFVFSFLVFCFVCLFFK